MVEPPVDPEGTPAPSGAVVSAPVPSGAVRWRAVRLRPTWGVVVLIGGGLLAVVVTRNVFVAAHRVLGWAAAAVIVAVLLTPLVRLLDRWLPRPLAYLGSLLTVLVVALLLGYGVFGDLRAQVDRIQQEAPAAAVRIEGRDDSIGALARDIGLADRVQSFVTELDQRLGTGGQALQSAALSFPPFFVSGILTVFLMIYGPRMVRAGIAEIDDDARRERLDRAVHDAVGRGRAYVLLALAEAAVVATTVWVGCHVLDVPAPTALAVLAGIVSLVPYVGIVLAWSPVLLLGLGFGSVGRVAAVAIAVVVMQAAESWWWRRRADGATLHVGPLLPVVAGLLGFELYRIGGALYGAAIAVFALAFADALAGDDDPVPTPVDDWEGDPVGAAGTASA